MMPINNIAGNYSKATSPLFINQLIVTSTCHILMHSLPLSDHPSMFIYIHVFFLWFQNVHKILNLFCSINVWRAQKYRIRCPNRTWQPSSTRGPCLVRAYYRTNWKSVEAQHVAESQQKRGQHAQRSQQLISPLRNKLPPFTPLPPNVKSGVYHIVTASSLHL